ncbi:response regulator transcription factor [Bdellovibrionota bacterium]
MSQQTILVVDDDKDLCLTMEKMLAPKYHVVTSQTSDEIPRLISDTKPDLVILDIMMPGTSGFQVCQQIREDHDTQNLPIIFLSAKSGEEDKVLGFQLGADDFITKPFSKRELIARIESKLRRTDEDSQTIKVGTLTIDLQSYQAYAEGRQLSLTSKEFNILRYLVIKRGQVVTREQLLSSVWKDAVVTDRTVDVHIQSLRKKLGSHSENIHTIYGMGYRFVNKES